VHVDGSLPGVTTAPRCSDAKQQKATKMIQYISTWLQLRADRRAVTALEYGLIAAAIAAVIATTVFSLGGTVNSTFSSINHSM